jgi:hypothetical protein
MNYTIIRKVAVIAIFLFQFLFTSAQPGDIPRDKETKPYRILTVGKQVTVKSTQDIKSIMVWTASGHRIVEQNEINGPSFTFTISINEKIFFLMMELTGEKRYTEKIGVR